MCINVPDIAYFVVLTELNQGKGPEKEASRREFQSKSLPHIKARCPLHLWEIMVLLASLGSTLLQ